jgi:D-arginine dehydrogenase
MAIEEFDFLVIGGGVAGCAAAYGLVAHGRVCVLERESTPGYHSTGRSAALHTETYGNAAIRALTVGSRAFLLDPPDGFKDHALLRPRGAMTIARADQRELLEQAYDASVRFVPSVRRLSPAEAIERVPVLNPDYVADAMIEPEAMDMDVNAIHQGYLKGLRAGGGRLVVDAEIRGLSANGGAWQASTPAGEFRAPVVVNAAGAWCDEIAQFAGVEPIGLVPKRRTAFTFAAPEDADPSGWPMVAGVAEEFYFKPESGLLLGSPANENPVDPHDVQPEELDVALGADRIEKATTMKIRRIERKWAGLRSFVADKTLVAGFEAGAPGFFWLAGQGGYGIMTSPAMSRVAAALAAHAPFPEDLAALGVSAADLSPARLRS